ncbi:MAG TPA: tRNA (N(6)-L-threonylcarbamoyladenosine(37)-C(2))-methylthiotransferase MtaB [Thermodesulfobacteriota bacterium]|nr:tRNA (N(6)-L-threonylcarbamoyladenosine(37)-C(2))-methylthiotransferase MtaB [Thermodesulfobacteriota bacterium]
MKSISFVTLGCKVNQYDTAVLKNKLPKSKYTTVPFPQKADVYVIDTCTVTHKADAEARHYINRAKRINPSGVVVVTGCYAQVSADEISQLKGVDYVVGNSDKFSSLMKIVREGSVQDTPKVFISDIFKEKKRKFETPDIDFFPDRTRAFLKVQDGCNYACTFCIIPYARGRSRSLDIDDVLGRIRLLRESGYKEIVLTGIHLASYGRDIGCELLTLLKRIEEEKILNRIRLSSLDPADINENFIKFLSESETVCPSFHISLQSGDEKILKEMRRRYKPEQFLELASNIRSTMPEASIGTDIMVGFPGESQKQFENSYHLLNKSELTYFHVFSYSKRKGTKAASMNDQIAPDVIKERSRILRELGMKKKIEFNSGFVGKELEVLVENNSKGTTRNYITVRLVKDNYTKGELIDVRVSGLKDDILIASKYAH